MREILRESLVLRVLRLRVKLIVENINIIEYVILFLYLEVFLLN